MSGSATERLYYTDAYLSEFSARIIDRADAGHRVYLDRTAFYPTSGGQPHDTGILSSSNVIDVIDEGECVAHVLDAPVNGDDVRGKVYWKRRFDNMQQHTGQHLVSAVFEDMFAAKTVSVHFGESYSTLDLETEKMSSHSLEEVEQRANRIVAENRAVTVGFEDAASAQGLRKAVDREGTLRIISIADLDRSACGGTHLRSTGEIGAILLRSTERVRKTVRVEFVCGLRAVARARADFQALSTIASALSTSLDAAAGLVSSQAAQVKESEQARRRLEKDLARYRAAELHAASPPDAAGVRFVHHTGETVDQLRTLAQALLNHERVVFVGSTAQGSILVAATEDSARDAGRLLKEALASTDGKGGGSPRLAQGSTSAETTAQAVTLIRDALARDR